MLRLRRPQSVHDDVGHPLGTRVVVALHRLAPDHECLDLGHVDVAAHGPGTLRGSRVVTVSSIGHRIRAGIHFDDLQWERSYSRVGAYGQSKLANLLFTYELQRRLAPHGTTIAAAAHPGGSRTELTRNLPALLAPVVSVLEPLFQGADMSALPTVRAATDLGVLGGQSTVPTDSASNAVTRKSLGPVTSHTTSTWSADCGRSPRSSPAWCIPSTDPARPAAD
jgi:NAD(P)-dependent dehydrogenase (short-subunit alcohol dehydrogenase family)